MSMTQWNDGQARSSTRTVFKVTLQLVLSAVLVGLTACSGDAEPVLQPTTVPTPSASESPIITPEPTPSAAFLAPLTGLPVDEAVTDRPFYVMINNLAPARPQSGLTQADTVWEILAEGGITRLIAIFQSKQFKEPIGPIRSIRPYFIQVGEFYNGVGVHAGASNDALAILQRQDKETLDEINNAGSYFYRDKSRKAPHNVYSTLEELRLGTEKRKYSTTAAIPMLTFAKKPIASITGDTATDIEIKFMLKSYKVSYHFNTEKSLYERSINNEPHIDKNNNEQLTATNLVVISAKHVTYDDVGRLEVDLDSGGDALLFQNGKAITAKWERKKGDVIRITSGGVELPFLPGITYYHVVPNSTAIDNYVSYNKIDLQD
jgi:hypothetical protein